MCLQPSDGSDVGPSERNSTLVEKLGGTKFCARLTAITGCKPNHAIAAGCSRNVTRAASWVVELVINCLGNRSGVRRFLGFAALSCISSWSDFVRRLGPPINPIVRGAFPLLVFFLAAIFSGVLEKTPLVNSLHMLTIIGGLGLIVVALGGRLPVVLNTPIAKCLLVLTFWFIVCTPFGAWPGGSVALFRDVWSKAALSFVFVAGCVLTIQQCKMIYKTIGYSVGVLATMTLALRGVDPTGRLGLLGTRYEGPNDLAWTLVLGLSFLLFLLFRGDRWQKIFAALLSAAILLALVKTGSRAGMIGLCMFAVFGFFQSSRSTRIRLALVIPPLLVVLFAITPPEVRSRYITFFGSGDKDYRFIDPTTLSAEERLQATARGSAGARWTLLKDSIHLTLTHPLLGVGPGGFQAAQNELAIARGEPKGAWHVTHNTYTQISSEMGIPGVVIYLMFLYQCFKALNPIVRSRYAGRDWEELRALARSLRASLVVLLTIAFFDSYGYDTNIPILAGLACALALIAQRKRALMTVPQQVSATPSALPEPALEPV